MVQIKNSNLKTSAKYSAIILILLMFLSSCSKNIGEEKHIVFNQNRTLTTKLVPKEKRISINDNKPFVLFFFSTSCGACKEAIPYLNHLNNEYKNEVEVIGIMNESLGHSKDLKLLNSYNVNFGVITERRSINYLSHAVGGIFGVPVFYFYDKNGNLVQKFLGLVPQNKLQDGFKKII